MSGGLMVKARPLVEMQTDYRWGAIVRKDATFDNKFLYSVKTTGVFCRPSCAARLPKIENVSFHETCEDAKRAGFRPCKRCRPDQESLRDRHCQKIQHVCAILNEAATMPSLTELAAEAGCSVYHFHRMFKNATGLTPRAYAEAGRMRRMQEQLAQSADVTSAIYDAGFSSSGRFYENSDRALGMTPTQFRAGGKNVEIVFAVAGSNFGNVLVAMTQRGVCAILLGDEQEVLLQDLRRRFPKAALRAGDEAFMRCVEEVIKFVETPSTRLQLPLDIQGTAFQQRVWLELTKIPAGTTASYSEIARSLGLPDGARAVANACAANSIAVAIPCHRVVRSGGDLAGYRWGVERKKELLRRETECSFVE